MAPAGASEGMSPSQRTGLSSSDHSDYIMGQAHYLGLYKCVLPVICGSYRPGRLAPR